MNELKSCPFCGGEVFLDKRPLWNGSHGYQNCYEFIIECENPKCRCRINLGANDTIYRKEKEARANAIEAWNRRAKDV